MSDAEQFVMLHEIMELRGEVIEAGGFDLTTAIVVSVALIVGAHLLVWVLNKRDPGMMDFMLPIASIVSIGISVALVICAVTTQNAIEEYEMLCEMYRTTYGPLPWEVA